MKNFILLSLIMTLFISCNEKVADDLLTPTNVVSNPTTDAPAVMDMRVVHKMDSSLSFVMHKMGTLSEACSLTPPVTGFSAENYTKADTTRNIDCVLDAQENDIYENGAKFEIQVDNKMCEYIEYQPYRFFKRQPGTTNRKVSKVVCDSTCSVVMPDECNRYYDRTTAVANGNYSSALFTTDLTTDYTQKALCTFNHIDAKCDDGQMIAETYLVKSYYSERCSLPAHLNQIDCEANMGTWITGNYCGAPGDPAGVITYEKTPLNDELSSCGGKLTACLDGAGVEQISNLDPLDIYNSSNDVNFKKELTVSSPKSLSRTTNRFVANFSRVCSDTTTNKAAVNFFDTPGYSFNGAENEKISYTYVTPMIDVNTDGTIDGTVYARHPFSGSIYGGSLDDRRYSTSPYYAVRCLDSARDVKAQIRLYIRDWDRNFDASYIYLSRVSDKALEAAGNSLMDNNGFYDTDIAWNDFEDWDDFFDKTGARVFTNNMCQGLTNEPNVDPNHGKNNFPGEDKE